MRKAQFNQKRRNTLKALFGSFLFGIGLFTKTFAAQKKASISYHLCTSCEHCIKACPQGAIYLDAVTIKINTNKCIGCGRCIEACKHRAITVK